MLEDHPDGSTATLVRRARQHAGLTQQVLATRADLALRTLTRLESGKGASVPTLVAIARVLDVPVGDLIGEDVAESAT